MSPERFIDLIRAEQESLRRFLLALCGGDESLADDIAQDALVRAYVASGSFLGLSKFSTWLFRMDKVRVFVKFTLNEVGFLSNNR